MELQIRVFTVAGEGDSFRSIAAFQTRPHLYRRGSVFWSKLKHILRDWVENDPDGVAFQSSRGPFDPEDLQEALQLFPRLQKALEPHYIYNLVVLDFADVEACSVLEVAVPFSLTSGPPEEQSKHWLVNCAAVVKVEAGDPESAQDLAEQQLLQLLSQDPLERGRVLDMTAYEVAPTAQPAESRHEGGYSAY